MLDTAAHRPLSGEARDLLDGVSRGLKVDAAESLTAVEQNEESLRVICTLPFATLVGPLTRTVRDLRRILGKEATLSAAGAEIALDRRLLEALRGPLVRLVRNEVDHGIELPATREAAGKHRAGVIDIRIEQSGNIVFVEVGDDGGASTSSACAHELRSWACYRPKRWPRPRPRSWRSCPFDRA